MKTRCWKYRLLTSLSLAAALLLRAHPAPSLPSTGGDFPLSLQTPGKVPERIILGFVSDPARSLAVTWRTSLAVETPRAEIAPAGPTADFQKDARSVPAATSKLDLAKGANAYHYRAIFEGLSPETTYAYRVGDGAVWSEWSHFRTASAASKPFRFLALGDAQDGLKSLWSRAVRGAYAHAPDARFILSVGDITSDGWDDARWSEFAYALGFIGTTMPFLATPGNHDLHRPPTDPEKGTVVGVQPTWRAHLTAPGNGPKGFETLRDTVWSLDYQGVRFLSLEANVYAEENFSESVKKLLYDAQPAWLEEQLKNNPNRWTVVIMHNPLYMVAKAVDFEELRKVFLPIFDRYHVDLVLAGHNHRYGRTPKLAGGRIVDPKAPGTVYTIMTSGPKTHVKNPQFDDLMAVTLDASQMYQVVDVGPDRLRYEAWNVVGTLVDSFELRKDGAGRTEYVSPGRPAARK